ncbi:hypothetical protein CO614_03065 [Lysobacteraceae bacterium NML120232]|nr:hypothetical protein CO614_03065 [Xanthomonadaceae bacterium NML120232]
MTCGQGDKKYPIARVVLGFPLLGGALAGAFLYASEILLHRIDGIFFAPIAALLVLVLFAIMGGIFGLIPALLCALWSSWLKLERDAAGMLHVAIAGGAISGVSGEMILNFLNNDLFGNIDIPTGRIAVVGMLSAVILGWLLFPLPEPETKDEKQNN